MSAEHSSSPEPGGASPAAGPLTNLLRRIDDRSAVVGVVGLGWVGLPMAAAMEAAGFRVLGFDLDADRVMRLNRGETEPARLGPELFAGLMARGRFIATTDLERLAETDAVLICVPTPLGPGREPDLSAVTAAADAVAATLSPGRLVVLESTTWPGTTREVLQPRLEATGLRCGRDVFLAFSPERVDPGRRDHDTRNTTRLVGGVDAASGEAASRLYRVAVDEVVTVSSSDVAEAAKLLENVYRAVNIALVNEFKTMLTAMDIDPWEVVDAAATKPYGFQSFAPGPGLGGHCIPVDPFYLAWKAEQVGHPARLVALAGEINHAMPDWVVERTRGALADRGVELAAARVLVLGLAYKPDIDDVRGSPSFALLTKLWAAGAQADYHDPLVAQTRPEWLPGHAVLHSIDAAMTDDEVLAAYDAVILATDHSAYDLARVARVARLVVDTRGALRSLRADGSDGSGGTIIGA